jgi:ABC-2 type transport system permease protein
VTLRAEILKMGTLPAAWLSLLSLAALIAVARGDVQYAQAGFLVLAVVTVASEYAGGQVRTSLVAVPRRWELLAAKTAVLGVTGGVAGVVAGHAWYLTLVTLLAAAVALLMRGAVPALTVLLGWFFVAAPLLRGGAWWVSYLPDADRAADGVGGMVVMGLWTLILSAVATVAFLGRDA